MSSGKIAVTILAVVIGIGVVANRMDMFKSRRVDVPESAALPESQKLPALATLTPAQKTALETLGRETCTAIAESDQKKLLALHNLDGLFNRTLQGFSIPAAERAGFLTSAKGSISSQPGALLRGSFGGSAAFLRLADIQGQAAALIRILTEDGAVMLAYLMPEFAGSKARFIDVYQLSTGCFASESMRDMIIPLLSSAGGDAPQMQLIKSVQKVTTARQTGDHTAVIKACESLPVELRKRPTMRMVYLESLMSSGDNAAYERELTRIQREEPDSVATSFKLLDLYMLKKKWKEAATAGLRVDEAAGGDAYLKAMSGMCLSWAEDFEEAEKVFDAAEALDPSLAEVMSFRLHLDCARGDYAALVKNMDKLKEKYSRQATPEGLVENFPKFQEFIDSPEYKAWKEKQ